MTARHLFFKSFWYQGTSTLGSYDLTHFEPDLLISSRRVRSADTILLRIGHPVHRSRIAESEA